MNKILIITGPTASGKSDLAIQMAEKYNGEIVSADAMQIYRKLNVGTAKVTVSEQKKVPHHLIDIVDMTAQFSVAEFLEKADEVVLDIISRGKLPIMVGGTGFYVKAFIGEATLDFVASNSDEVKLLNKEPIDTLVAQLKQLDNDLAHHVDLKNKQRVVRAIQIARHGKHSDIQKRPNYNSLIIAIDWERELLYQRINSRVYNMIDNGLIDEAKLILEAGGETIQAGKAIGYKELFPYLEHNMPLETAISQIQQDSRRYAKRQLTYLRHQIPGLVWIDGYHAKALLSDKINNWLNKKTHVN